MLVYVIACILLYFFYFFNRGNGLFVIMTIVVAVIIYYLPNTGYDYIHYKADYDSSYISSSFPFFASKSILTAEPFYKFYTSAIANISGLPFNGFLSLNYVICNLILLKSLSALFSKKSVVIFLLFSTITIVPTVFYFSPRSSISFVLALTAFIYFVRSKQYIGYLFIFLTMGFHSQFLPVLIIIAISSRFYTKKFIQTKNKKRSFNLHVFFIVSILIILLKFPDALFQLLSPVLSIFPTFKIITHKIGYFSKGESSYRLSSILSIVVFPVLHYYLVSRQKAKAHFTDSVENTARNKFIFLFSIVVISGMVFNIILINKAHVAGRLARFSDFSFMMIGLGIIFLNTKKSRALLPLILVGLLVVAIFIFGTLYNFDLTIF